MPTSPGCQLAPVSPTPATAIQDGASRPPFEELSKLWSWNLLVLCGLAHRMITRSRDDHTGPGDSRTRARRVHRKARLRAYFRKEPRQLYSNSQLSKRRKLKFKFSNLFLKVLTADARRIIPSLGMQKFFCAKKRKQ